MAEFFHGSFLLQRGVSPDADVVIITRRQTLGRAVSRRETALVITVRELKRSEVAQVDDHLPLNRLDEHEGGRSTYLIAWEEDRPIGHAHLAWQGTHLGIPEIQDVYVVPDRRRRGIATLLIRAAEEEARSHGWTNISLSVSRDGNPEARRLYDRIGYVDAGVEAVRVAGTIMLRGRPFEVDDTLVYLRKRLEGSCRE